MSIHCNIDGAQKEKDKGFVNIGGVWKQIDKVFGNIGGTWKEGWSAEKILSYYGVATALSENVRLLAATSVGDYALFGGGESGYDDDCSEIVNTYNIDLVKSTATKLSTTYGRRYLAATAMSNRALFGGGRSYSETVSTVDAYNTSLTRSIPTALSVTRQDLAATSVGDYALFGGGRNLSGLYFMNTVDAYQCK